MTELLSGTLRETSNPPSLLMSAVIAPAGQTNPSFTSADSVNSAPRLTDTPEYLPVGLTGSTTTGSLEIETSSSPLKTFLEVTFTPM